MKGHRVAIVAASQMRDHTPGGRRPGHRPGIASRVRRASCVAAVRAARARAEIVVVYLHWGTEGQGCPNADQRAVSATLAAAGADAVVGTHARQLLEESPATSGSTYVATDRATSWWRERRLLQRHRRAPAGLPGPAGGALGLEPARIDRRGVPVPATSETAARIAREWARLVGCTGLTSRPG